MESGFVMESIVFGRKKLDKQGEEVRAIVVPDLEEIKIHHQIDIDSPDIEIVKSIMRQAVNETNSSMASYKRISDFDIQFDELEKTSSKKIKRFVYK